MNNKGLPFLELMKLPLNIGNAVVEGGQAGLKGGDPLMATAKRIEAAIKKPFSFLPMEMGGQPQLPSFGGFGSFPSPTQLLTAPPPLPTLPAMTLPAMAAGGEIVGSGKEISGHADVRTSVY
jgi:hypothetical protein